MPLSPVRSVPGAKGRKFLVALLHQPAPSLRGKVQHSFHLHVKSWGGILEQWRKRWQKSRLSEMPAFHQCCWKMAENLQFSLHSWGGILEQQLQKGDRKVVFLKSRLFTNVAEKRRKIYSFHYIPLAGSLNSGKKVAEKSSFWKASFSPMLMKNGANLQFSLHSCGEILKQWQKGGRKVVLPKASFSPVFLNNGSKGTFSLLVKTTAHAHWNISHTGNFNENCGLDVL